MKYDLLFLLLLITTALTLVITDVLVIFRAVSLLLAHFYFYSRLSGASCIVNLHDSYYIIQL